MEALGFGLFGLVLGSFLNVCIDRLPRGESVAEGRSRCDSCGRVLSARELIPLLSYAALGGRCRTCRARIPLRVLLVELGTGLLFGLIWLRYPASLKAVLIAAYAALLIVILVIDLEQGRILNKLSYPAIGLALLAVPFTPGRNADQLLIGGAAAFGLLLLIAWIYPAGMGLGDVKLAAFIGLTVGYPQVWLALFLAFVGGGLISGALVLARVLGRKDPIAFGPFLAAGAIATLLYGDSILTWWSHGV
jgi:leader peptidase (prepilin peptidase)/N-methyltransferase